MKSGVGTISGVWVFLLAFGMAMVCPGIGCCLLHYGFVLYFVIIVSCYNLFPDTCFA